MGADKPYFKPIKRENLDQYVSCATDASTRAQAGLVYLGEKTSSGKENRIKRARETLTDNKDTAGLATVS